MAQMVGARRTAEWLLLGKPFSAQEALDSGFITAITPAGLALDHARTVAAQLAAQPGQALRSSKRILRLAGQTALDPAFDAERDLFTESLRSEADQAAFRRKGKAECRERG